MRMTLMGDIADQSQPTEQMWLEAAIRAARGVPGNKAPRSTCNDCGEALETHRLAYGLCLECAQGAEARQRLWWHA